MAEYVYALCAIISVGCAVLLYRSYRKRPVRLLLWVMTSFGFIALNNVMLFVDRVILPTAVDLSVPRAFISLLAAVVLLYGLIWEAR